MTKRSIFIKITPIKKYITLMTDARKKMFFFFSKIPRMDAVTHRERRYLKNVMSPRDIIIPRTLPKRLYIQPVEEKDDAKNAKPKGFVYVSTLA